MKKNQASPLCRDDDDDEEEGAKMFFKIAKNLICISLESNYIYLR